MVNPTERGRVPFRVAVTAVVIFVAGPALAHFGIVPPLVGFGLFVLGGAIGLLNTIAGVVTIVRGARGRGIATIIISDIPGMLLIVATVHGGGPPPINDISTDLSDPPAFAQDPANSGRDMSYPEGFKEIVRQAYPDLKPLRVAGSPDEVFARVGKVAADMPAWKTTALNGSARTLEGTATSELFRFQDDFVIRVRAEGAGSIVDMRSKSRDGKGDLGANANRIRGFFAAVGSH